MVGSQPFLNLDTSKSQKLRNLSMSSSIKNVTAARMLVVSPRENPGRYGSTQPLTKIGNYSKNRPQTGKRTNRVQTAIAR